MISSSHPAPSQSHTSPSAAAGLEVMSEAQPMSLIADSMGGLGDLNQPVYLGGERVLSSTGTLADMIGVRAARTYFDNLRADEVELGRYADRRLGLDRDEPEVVGPKLIGPANAGTFRRKLP